MIERLVENGKLATDNAVNTARHIFSTLDKSNAAAAYEHLFTLMAKTWEPGFAIITGPEDWDRAIIHLWGESVNEFKRAFPHLLSTPDIKQERQAKLYAFPKPLEESRHSVA